MMGKKRKTTRKKTFSSHANRIGASQAINSSCLEKVFNLQPRSRQDVAKFSVVVPAQDGCIFHCNDVCVRELWFDGDRRATFGTLRNESGKL